MSSWLNRLGKSLLSVAVQPQCATCDRAAETVLCRACEQQLRGCQLPPKPQKWHGNLPVLAWGRYDGNLKRAIAAFKYSPRPELAQLLGTWMGEAWQQSELASQIDRALVVPIPLHAAKLATRGYNQAELLGRGFCQATRLPLKPQGLARVRETAALFGLDAETRKQTLTDALSLGSDFLKRTPELPVLICDDIYTTGATVSAATDVLRRHRIRPVGIIALAIAGDPDSDERPLTRQRDRATHSPR